MNFKQLKLKKRFLCFIFFLVSFIDQWNNIYQNRDALYQENLIQSVD